MADRISEPIHYTLGDIECRHIIETVANGEGFYVGNIIKYIYRYKHKGEPVEDLKKARQYLDFLIELIEKEESI